MSEENEEAENHKIRLEFLRQLVAIEPQFQDFIDGETDDDDPDYQVGTYLVMGNISDWVVAHRDSPVCGKIFERLESEFPNGLLELQGFIAVGFIESIPYSAENKTLISSNFPYLQKIQRHVNNNGAIFMPELIAIVSGR